MQVELSGFSSSSVVVDAAFHVEAEYLLNSIMQGPAKERLKMQSSNAECVSMWGDKPTPDGYSFTYNKNSSAINVVQKHYKESSVDDVPLTGLDSSLLGRSQGSGTMRFFGV